MLSGGVILDSFLSLTSPIFSVRKYCWLYLQNIGRMETTSYHLHRHHPVIGLWPPKWAPRPFSYASKVYSQHSSQTDGFHSSAQSPSMAPLFSQGKSENPPSLVQKAHRAPCQPPPSFTSLPPHQFPLFSHTPSEGNCTGCYHCLELSSPNMHTCSPHLRVYSHGTFLMR